LDPRNKYTVLVPDAPGATLRPGGRLLLIGTPRDDDLKVSPGGWAPEFMVELNGPGKCSSGSPTS